MGDKTLSRAILEKLMRLTHEMRTDYVAEDKRIRERIELAKELPNYNGMAWLSYVELVDTVYRLAQGDKVETMWRVLEVLGWQVVDDAEEEG